VLSIDRARLVHVFAPDSRHGRRTDVDGYRRALLHDGLGRAVLRPVGGLLLGSLGGVVLHRQ